MSYKNKYADERITKNLPITDTVLESQFLDIIRDTTAVVEGAYIAYQIDDLNIKLGELGTAEVEDPSSTPFYHNTASKESYFYTGGAWTALDRSLLQVVVDLGFTSAWLPINTLIREEDNYLDLLIPHEYLPLNASISKILFVGFKNLIVSDDVIPVLGIPLENEDGERFFERTINTNISLPISFSGSFIPLVDTFYGELENSTGYDSDEVETMNYILSEYRSYTRTSNFTGPDLNGSTLSY